MSAGLRAGYKQTEVGVIPDDWDVLPIAALTTEFRGGAPLKPSDFTTLGVKVLPKGGVGRTGVLRIADKDIQYCSIDYANAHPRNQVDKAYTIVVLRDLVPSGPSIGLMVEIGTDERFVLAQGVYGFKVDDEKADARYLIQLSNTRWYRNLANGIMVGSTQVHITNTAYKKAELPVPPLPEQRAIASALSDVDALLGGLDSLITKKQGLKVAAMQQLLTSQTRLPGFSGEWEVKRLGAMLTICHGKNQREVEVSGGLYPILATGGQIGTASRALYDKPSVLIGRKGTINQPRYMDTPFWTVDTLFYSIVKGDNDAKFLYYRFCSIDWMQYNEASGVPSLNARTIENVEIAAPLPLEQTAIAAILSDMDTKLAALQARRSKTQALKQAMMQELLTGRIRLV